MQMCKPRIHADACIVDTNTKKKLCFVVTLPLLRICTFDCSCILPVHAAPAEVAGWETAVAPRSGLWVIWANVAILGLLLLWWHWCVITSLPGTHSKRVTLRFMCTCGEIVTVTGPAPNAGREWMSLCSGTGQNRTATMPRARHNKHSWYHVSLFSIINSNHEIIISSYMVSRGTFQKIIITLISWSI